MFELRFETENDAFKEGMSSEVARVLKEAARKVADGVTEGVCRDTHGNCIGRFRLDRGEHDDLRA